jgi:hypothetical protein
MRLALVASVLCLVVLTTCHVGLCCAVLCSAVLTCSTKSGWMLAVSPKESGMGSPRAPAHSRCMAGQATSLRRRCAGSGFMSARDTKGKNTGRTHHPPTAGFCLYQAPRPRVCVCCSRCVCCMTCYVVLRRLTSSVALIALSAGPLPAGLAA